MEAAPFILYDDTNDQSQAVTHICMQLPELGVAPQDKEGWLGAQVQGVRGLQQHIDPVQLQEGPSNTGQMGSSSCVATWCYLTYDLLSMVAHLVSL